MSMGGGRSRRASSLPVKVALAVLLAVAGRSALLLWTSHEQARELFRSLAEEGLSERLQRTSSRVDAALRTGRLLVQGFAGDARLHRAGSQAAGPLDELIESGLLDAAWLTDSQGHTLAAAGTAAPPDPLPKELRRAGLHAAPDPDAAQPLAVAAVPGRSRRWLVGSFSRDALAHLLSGDTLPGVGRGYLLDAEGAVILSGASGPEAETRLPLGLLRGPPEAGGSVAFSGGSGEPHIGLAAPLSELGWSVAITAPLDRGFGPVEPLLWRLFLLDLALVLCVVWAAYRITARLVRPVEVLCQGASRIAEGDLDIEVPETRTDDELGQLTRVFNAMARRLRDDQIEIHAGHRKLREQNQALQAANEVLAQLSITDGLTKLHNHRFFQDHLTRELKRVKRTGEDLSLLLIDIDDFKALNDRHGHAVGDDVLARIAQVMNATVRESDLLARYGGEEFVVLAATDMEGAVRLAEKLRMAIQETAMGHDEDSAPLQVSVSIGVARFKGDRKAFFRDADRALYAAKAAGKNCVVVDAEPA
jgi:diguanylate cyclase (GGDEF)-like protein